MEPEGIVEFQSANSINDIHDLSFVLLLNDSLLLLILARYYLNSFRFKRK
jgi:hypothetical protein